MQLIQCHIENFGKLQHFDYTFKAGLNAIKAENGWGKTTFATFIKAMFYGLPVTTKQKLNENERKKYWPWQGGNFGGNLVFSLQGKQYRIERFFGKTKADDTFKLFDVATGKRSTDFTENIGVEIFGLDEGAFERSSYIPQKLLNSNINESMTQKLNHLLQGGNEEFNYESADALLDKKRAGLSNSKKTGAIENLERKIDDVVAQIRELESRAQALPTLQAQVDQQTVAIADWQQQQAQVQRQINTYAQSQQKHAHQALYSELARQVADTERAIVEKQSVLNGHVTDAATVEQYSTLAKQIATDENTVQVQTAYQDAWRYHATQMRAGAGQTGKRKWWCLGGGIVSLMVLLSGLLVLSTSLVGGVALLIAGVAGVFAVGFVYLVNLIRTQNLPSLPPQSHLDQPDVTILSQTLAEKKTRLAGYLTQFRLPTNLSDAEKLLALKQVLADVAELQKRLTREQAELAKFQAEQHFDTNEVAAEADINQLQAAERELQRQIDAARENKAQVIARINQIQNDLAALDDWETQKASLQTAKQQLEQEFAAVKTAQKYLKAAKENLATQFLAPMKQGLGNYLQLLTGQNFAHLHLDTDFQITLDEFGQARGVDYYSKGYQNSFDLCLRLALIDALYQQEKPFIVLDDPFVNLDESKTAQAKAFLAQLAEHYQLVYFTCHAARC